MLALVMVVGTVVTVSMAWASTDPAPHRLNPSLRAPIRTSRTPRKNRPRPPTTASSRNWKGLRHWPGGHQGLFDLPYRSGQTSGISPSIGPGNFLNPQSKQRLGKKNVINNFCTAVPSNYEFCTACHAVMAGRTRISTLPLRRMSTVWSVTRAPAPTANCRGLPVTHPMQTWNFRPSPARSSRRLT